MWLKLDLCYSWTRTDEAAFIDAFSALRPSRSPEDFVALLVTLLVTFNINIRANNDELLTHWVRNEVRSPSDGHRDLIKLGLTYGLRFNAEAVMLLLPIIEVSGLGFSVYPYLSKESIDAAMPSAARLGSVQTLWRLLELRRELAPRNGVAGGNKSTELCLGYHHLCVTVMCTRVCSHCDAAAWMYYRRRMGHASRGDRPSCRLSRDRRCGVSSATSQP